MLERQLNFQKLGLGLFIHYGLYSKYEQGEWYWNMNHLTEDEYYNDEIKKVNLNVNWPKIVKWAKNNDFKYIVLTSRHHDGFALYQSPLNKYDLSWLDNQQKDVINEFITACQNEGIQCFLYYATMDWLNYSREETFENTYQNIEFLLQKYGNKINGFWFDGNWANLPDRQILDNLYQMIRKYNSECIIIDNTGLEHKGEVSHPEIDSVTFEQGGIAENNQLPFESVLPIIDHWGSAKNDFNYKSLPELIKILSDTRLQGGNLLLNLSLNKNDEIDNLDQALINKLHQWSQLNDYWWQKDLSNYYVLKNLKSGAHIDNIHFGNQELTEIELLNIKNPQTISKLYYLDTGEQINFKIQNNKVYIKPKNFKYGYNTIYRIIKIERND